MTGGCCALGVSGPSLPTPLHDLSASALIAQGCRLGPWEGCCRLLLSCLPPPPPTTPSEVPLRVMAGGPASGHGGRALSAFHFGAMCGRRWVWAPLPGDCARLFVAGHCRGCEWVLRLGLFPALFVSGCGPRSGGGCADDDWLHLDCWRGRWGGRSSKVRCCRVAAAFALRGRLPLLGAAFLSRCGVL